MKMVSRKHISWAAAALLVLVLIGAVAAVRRNGVVSPVGDTPLAVVKRGDLDLRVHATGELRASQSIALTAPPIGEGALQITHLLHTGSPVKKGDLVIEFNPGEQQYKLEQNRSELLQADEEITKAKADAAVQAAQDEVALLKARFDVRRAELEVGKNEIVSDIDAQKNRLSLEQARRALAQLEQDIGSRSVSGHATIALAQEKRHKAQLAMTQAQQNIDKMSVRSPRDGVIAIEKNTETEWFWGTPLAEYREGDQTQPGSSVARVIDPGQMEVIAKIGERDRSLIKVGQASDIRIDALPGSPFRGVVTTVGGMAAARAFWEDQAAGFDITIQLPDADPRLRAGFTAQVVIPGERRNNVLYVPRQALFIKDGKRVAYVKNGEGFEPTDVKILCETESRAVIEGLKLGDEVALIDPTAPVKASAATPMEPEAGGSVR